MSVTEYMVQELWARKDRLVALKAIKCIVTDVVLDSLKFEPSSSGHNESNQPFSVLWTKQQKSILQKVEFLLEIEKNGQIQLNQLNN